MKFVRLTQVIKKVCDTEITKVNDIKDVLSRIKDKELTCAIRLSKGPLMDKVRIKELGDCKATLSVIKNKSVLIKLAEYQDIEYCEIVTESEILINKPNTSRWDILIDDE